MRHLKWKVALIILILVLAGWQLHYSLVLYNLTPEREAGMSADALRKLHNRALHLGLDLLGGMHLVLEVDKSKLSPEEAKGAVDRALEIIRNRVDQFGVSEPLIQRQGENRIVVQLPGIVDRDRAREIIGKTALLEFKLLADANVTEEVVEKIDAKVRELTNDSLSLNRYIERLHSDLMVVVEDVPKVDRILQLPEIRTLIPPGYTFLWGKTRMSEGFSYRPLYLVKKEAEITGAAILDAVPGIGTQDNPMGVKVDLTMRSEAKRKWAQVTGANIGKRIAIVLDDVVQSAPVVRDRIPNGRTQITLGSASMEEAKDLAVVLKAGALPAPVKIIEERSVGPSLGRDSIRAGIRSILLGGLLVLVFVIFYYRVAGVVASFALVLNVLLLLAILSAFRATLTLPGIAGIVLTIGTAVDANVLIFERIREELLSGKTVRTAISIGYDKAFRTILDANLTTFFTGLILYYFGTGPIKGFAVTLNIGIVVSFFTALFVTRVIFDLIMLNPEVKHISI